MRSFRRVPDVAAPFKLSTVPRLSSRAAQFDLAFAANDRHSQRGLKIA
jgi:hypothetical protein